MQLYNTASIQPWDYKDTGYSNIVFETIHISW
jgi:hypothetical protein